jgi:hypothetical protein
VRGGFYKVRNDPDLVTSKLAALHYYQLSLQAPKPPGGSSTPPRRNVEAIFKGEGKCPECHMPTL